MSNSLKIASFNLPVPVNSLDNYIKRVNQLPFLSLEEEQSLAERFYHYQDLQAARQLVMAHLRFVVRIARHYSGYGLAQSDLIQEGNLGLMKAVKRFDPSVGVRLVSFAVHWIKAEIHEFILRNWRIVKIATTKAQRKLFFNLRKKTQAISHYLREQDVSDVAADLNVPAETVRLMENRMTARDSTYESVITAEGEKTWSAENYLEDENSNPAHLLEKCDWSSKQRQALAKALQALDARSLAIVQSRWLKEQKATLHELADRFTISPERVRQIEKNSLQKIRSIMELAC